MIRILAMLAGLSGALTLSQFPEFSQQYLQRLSGAVNELKIVVTGFDVAAAASGRTRQEALEAMQASGFDADLKATLANSIRRHERLSGDLAALRAAGPLERLAQPWNMADAELVKATWEDYKPAVPTTSEGAISAGIGYLAGWGIVTGGLGLLLSPFRRRRARP